MPVRDRDDDEMLGLCFGRMNGGSGGEQNGTQQTANIETDTESGDEWWEDQETQSRT